MNNVFSPAGIVKVSMTTTTPSHLAMNSLHIYYSLNINGCHLSILLVCTPDDDDPKR